MCLNELKWKRLKNKGQTEEEYSFIKFHENYFVVVINKYPCDNDILQRVIKTTTEDLKSWKVKTGVLNQWHTGYKIPLL